MQTKSKNRVAFQPHVTNYMKVFVTGSNSKVLEPLQFMCPELKIYSRPKITSFASIIKNVS